MRQDRKIMKIVYYRVVVQIESMLLAAGLRPQASLQPSPLWSHLMQQILPQGRSLGVTEGYSVVTSHGVGLVMMMVIIGLCIAFDM